MINFIDDNRYRWGVEPICRLLPIAPSTYYATRKAHSSKRSQLDEYLKAELERVWEENYRVYGADKSGRSSTGSSWNLAESGESCPLHSRAPDA